MADSITVNLKNPLGVAIALDVDFFEVVAARGLHKFPQYGTSQVWVNDFQLYDEVWILNIHFHGASYWTDYDTLADSVKSDASLGDGVFTLEIIQGGTTIRSVPGSVKKTDGVEVATDNDSYLNVALEFWRADRSIVLSTE